MLKTVVWPFKLHYNKAPYHLLNPLALHIMFIDILMANYDVVSCFSWKGKWIIMYDYVCSCRITHH